MKNTPQRTFNNHLKTKKMKCTCNEKLTKSNKDYICTSCGLAYENIVNNFFKVNYSTKNDKYSDLIYITKDKTINLSANDFEIFSIILNFNQTYFTLKYNHQVYMFDFYKVKYIEITDTKIEITANYSFIFDIYGVFEIN